MLKKNDSSLIFELQLMFFFLPFFFNKLKALSCGTLIYFHFIVWNCIFVDIYKTLGFGFFILVATIFLCLFYLMIGKLNFVTKH